MDMAGSLEETAEVLVQTAMDLVPCDHAGYSEIDLYFGRTKLYSSEPEVEQWVERRASVWAHFMPDHPVLKFRNNHPDVPVVRLSDVTDLGAFYRSGLYNELFCEVETNHQLVIHLGFDPGEGRQSGSLPLTLGIPLNRKGRDFSDRDLQVLSLLQRMAQPALRRRRAEHQFRLLDSADLSPDLLRSLMAFGLSMRQAEVAFWMLKNKSNTDIGTILDIGTQTVRQHSMAIFRRLGVDGRQTLMRSVFRAIAAVG